MIRHILNPDTVKIEDLASGQDRWEYLMLFGGRQYKDGIVRRFFQRFQEGVESCLRQHVHLIDDVYLIAAGLGWYAHLLYQAADIINRIIRSGIQLVNIERTAVLERYTRMAHAASLAI